MEEERQSRALWMLVAAVVAAGVAAVSVVGYLRSREGPPARTEEAATGRVSEGVETRSVVLYFGAPDDGSLVREYREIIAGGGTGAEAKRAIEALARGPLQEGIATLPPETTVQDVFLDSGGRLYLDVGRELRAFHWGGTSGERQTIRSILRTLSTNFPQVTSVQFLEEGHPLDTIGGHVDLSRPLWVDDWL